MVTAIFPAAGQGKRMQAGMNKVFMELAGMPIFIRTLLKFSGCDAIDKLIVVVGRDEVDFIKGIIGRVPGLKPYKVVAGGSERQYSVRNGLAAVDPGTEVVLVHDAARPLVSEETILATIEAAKKVGGAVDNNTPVELFVRKNKDDKVAKSFYYLGRMQINDAKEMMMKNTGNKVVEFKWDLDVPVREDIYDYITDK